MQNGHEEAHNGNEKQTSLPIRIITKLKYHWLLMKDLSTRGKLVYIQHDLGVRLSRAYLAMLVRHYRRRKQRLPDNIRVQHMAHHHEHASQNYNPHPYPERSPFSVRVRVLPSIPSITRWAGNPGAGGNRLLRV
jgi:hypothetical protein